MISNGCSRSASITTDRDRANYYRAIQSVRAQGSLNCWLSGHFDAASDRSHDPLPDQQVLVERDIRMSA